MDDTKAFDILSPFKSIDFGIADWADGIKAWATENRDVVQPIKWFVNDLIVGVEGVMHAIPPVARLAMGRLDAGKAILEDSGPLYMPLFRTELHRVWVEPAGSADIGTGGKANRSGWLSACLSRIVTRLFLRRNIQTFNVSCRLKLT